MLSRKLRAAAASSSSIFERAKPTWMRIQSPGWRSSSSSKPMLMARFTPLTSTLARSGRSASNSTIKPGIPRHIGFALLVSGGPQPAVHQGLDLAGADAEGGAQRLGDEALARLHRRGELVGRLDLLPGGHHFRHPVPS